MVKAFIDPQKCLRCAECGAVKVYVLLTQSFVLIVTTLILLRRGFVMDVEIVWTSV